MGTVGLDRRCFPRLRGPVRVLSSLSGRCVIDCPLRFRPLPRVVEANKVDVVGVKVVVASSSWFGLLKGHLVVTFRVIGPVGLITASALSGALAIAGFAAPAVQADAKSRHSSSKAVHRNILMLSDDSWGSLRSVSAGIRSNGGKVVGVYPVAHSLLVDVPEGWVAPLGVVAVPDRALRVTGSAGTDATSTMRATLGGAAADGGAGITVAVVDTGIASVGDLTGRVSHISVVPGAPGDGFGHGTFIAGLIAGSGASSAGRYAGIAPAAKLLDVRVASATGDTSLSSVLAGLQAVSDRHDVDPSVRVLNLSLSEDSPVPPSLDPLSQALETLWGDGITVVVAAGNDGPSSGSVTAPGNDPVVLTVGADDEGATASRWDDSVPAFSSRGVAFGSQSKPDLVAPGVSLVSLRDPASVVDNGNPTARVGDSYFKGTGTSMAAAVTSGAVAALLSKRPSLSPDDVKALLMGTAYDIRARGNADGAGGLDLGTALVARVPRYNNNGQQGDGPDSGPMSSSSAAWAAFATAWASGDWASTQQAWAALPDGVQRWAAQAFALSAVLNGASDDATTQARAWSARAWSARAWSSTDWLARAWSARAWSSDDWAARAWSARAWSARAWSDDDWSSFLWTARAWSARAWSARAWSTDSWGS
jgi:serine protease AprX